MGEVNLDASKRAKKKTFYFFLSGGTEIVIWFDRGHVINRFHYLIIIFY